MDTRIIKIALLAAAFAGTLFLFISGSWGWGILMVLVTAVIAVLTFRSVRLLFAFLQLRRQRFDRVGRILEKMNPDKLWPKSKGYYNFLFGTYLMSNQKITQSESYFRKALKHGMRFDHDKAMVKLNLAGIMMAKQKRKEAQILIKEAKKLDKRGMMAREIKEMEMAMKKPQRIIRQRR